MISLFKQIKSPDEPWSYEFVVVFVALIVGMALPVCVLAYHLFMMIFGAKQ